MSSTCLGNKIYEITYPRNKVESLQNASSYIQNSPLLLCFKKWILDG